MNVFRCETKNYISSEVQSTRHNHDTVEVFAQSGTFFGVRSECRGSETTQVSFNSIEEFKKFVDEVNWVFEQAQKSVASK